MLKMLPFHWILISFLLACNSSDEEGNQGEEESEMISETTQGAVITEVSFSGSENAYTFQVTISSPDLGCNQYADWWEVIDTDGNLIYRRILAHSHVDEQPFTRSGVPVQIAPDTEVYVRAHMNNSGFGAKAFRGNVSAGFNSFDLSPDFAANLENQQPLPSGCAF